LLCICIAMELSVQETQTILKQCHEVSLYAKDRRDAIILFGLERKWNVSGIDDALFEAGEKLLT
ncbi:MAG: XRE family transcriptional regulator, partial [Oscillospiraceae bacterium]|nr:XRE family transcriptional regulator [Oscillospiraceae bacterium]